MKSSFLAFLFLVISLSSSAQLFFKNQSQTNIKLCIGYYIDTDTFKGWVTEGWYTLKANEMKCLYCRPLNNRFYYYYGFTDDSLHKEYSGTNNLKVASKPFKILNADQDTGPLKNKKYYYRRFRQVNTSGKRTFTVTLGGMPSEAPANSDSNKDTIITTPTIFPPK